VVGTADSVALSMIMNPLLIEALLISNGLPHVAIVIGMFA
jgi:hypothetical protein